mmetsp:Transcript_26666/g.57396  ORF Transcript_26666/g.57396 Transcript_26666/m.57396 type:complete len:104 (-) Transcript_26666:172-483(-)
MRSTTTTTSTTSSTTTSTTSASASTSASFVYVMKGALLLHKVADFAILAVLAIATTTIFSTVLAGATAAVLTVDAFSTSASSRLYHQHQRQRQRQRSRHSHPR